MEATLLLARSIAEAENVYDHEQVFEELRTIAKQMSVNVTDMLCSTATQIALENTVDLFIVMTENGNVARALAKQRPMQTILACSTQPEVVRQINTTRGVIGFKVPKHLKQHQDVLIGLVLKSAKEQGYCLPGNKVMIFTTDDGDKDVSFKMIEVDEE